MKESRRIEYGELPQVAGLAEAIQLNQQIWRRRDNFVSISSPIEIPEKFTRPVFDRVLDKFGSYVVDDIHRVNKPLVGYSVLPETPMSWGYGYYFPNMGKNRPMKLFEEFGTDWLAKVAYGLDPYKENIYLGGVNTRIKRSEFSLYEDLLLVGLVRGLEEGSISKERLTDMFARIYISGDLEYFKKVTVKLPDGKKKTYGAEISNLEEEDMASTIRNREIDGKLIMALAKPFVFAASSGLQFYRFFRTAGQTGYPGVINLCGLFQSPIFLAHEYIHSLNFHEKVWSGIPIKGYKLMGGIVLKPSEKP